jgi:hypothetical protein
MNLTPCNAAYESLGIKGFSKNSATISSVKARYWNTEVKIEAKVNPLNAKLNPICHLLALLRAHHILHVSSLWVKDDRHDVNHK